MNYISNCKVKPKGFESHNLIGRTDTELTRFK